MKTQGKLEPGPGLCLIFQEGLHRTHGRPGWGGEGEWLMTAGSVRPFWLGRGRAAKY